jgi:uncharacterized protein (DUF1684 family)
MLFMRNTLICFYCVACLLFACNSNPTVSDYEQEVNLWRNQKDTLFRADKSSPFYKLKNFKKLNYFPINKDYAVKAAVFIEPNPDIVQMQTTTERLTVYLKYFKFVFTLHNTTDTLWGYVKPQDHSKVFLPFKDLTNGTLTYGAGRYIDLDWPQADTVIIDFNYSYNPYCHYNEEFSCPIVPFDNRLKFEIIAGEMNY